ncbi:unannotated protein [freshwater metagenome]|uniref:Unannotated protein n=1 Tax=freshwater metagenome TaxID=449393 RepID=A0A6J6PHA2_9ZZZZ
MISALFVNPKLEDALPLGALPTGAVPLPAGFTGSHLKLMHVIDPAPRGCVSPLVAHGFPGIGGPFGTLGFGEFCEDVDVASCDVSLVDGAVELLGVGATFVATTTFCQRSLLPLLTHLTITEPDLALAPALVHFVPGALAAAPCAGIAVPIMRRSKATRANGVRFMHGRLHGRGVKIYEASGALWSLCHRHQVLQPVLP